MSKYDYLQVGDKIGYLELKERLLPKCKKKNRMPRWLCKCVCGKEVVRRVDYLANKIYSCRQSCGCKHPNILRGNQSMRWTGYGEVSGNYFKQIKNGAKTRNHAFKITIEFMWELFLKQDRRCALTGWPLIFGSTYTEQTASLDRIDSTKDYTEDNVRWLHKDVNFIKMDFSDTDFVETCRAVANNNPTDDEINSGYGPYMG